MTLPVSSTIVTTINSNTLLGKVLAPGKGTHIPAPSVTVNANIANQALLTGAPLLVVDVATGPSNIPVFVTSSSPRYTFVGSNINGSIIIIPTLVPISQLVTNPVAIAVGEVLNALIPVAVANPGSDLAYVESQLIGLSGDPLQTALLQIAPAPGLIGVAREGFNTVREFQRVWLEHLQRNRYTCCRTNCCPPCRELIARPCCSPCDTLCTGPRVWGGGFGTYGHQDSKDQLNGYRATTWGGMLAFELPIICYLRAGVGGGIAVTDLDESAFGNKTTLHDYQGTLYFTYDTNSWFVDGGFSFGWNRYDGTRQISFPSVNRTAGAKYDGQEYSGFAVAGYQYYSHCFELTPLASVLYTHLNINDYTETGANSLDLHINRQQYDFVESGLGAKVAYFVKWHCGLFIPEVHSLWLHDFIDDTLNVTASFTGLGAAGGSFVNTGPTIDRDTWNIGGSLTYLFNSTFSIQLVYDYERSSTHFDHQGMVELAIDF